MVIWVLFSSCRSHDDVIFMTSFLSNISVAPERFFRKQNSFNADFQQYVHVYKIILNQVFVLPYIYTTLMLLRFMNSISGVFAKTFGRRTENFP